MELRWSLLLGDIPSIIPHAELGAYGCCGRLFGRVVKEHAMIACNECGEIVGKIPARDLQRTLDEFELELEIATALCRHCRSVNLVPGLLGVEVFVCNTCGKHSSNSPVRESSAGAVPSV